MGKKWYVYMADDEVDDDDGGYDDETAGEQENLPGSDGPEGP